MRRQAFGFGKRIEATVNEQMVPPRPILVEKENGFPVRPGARAEP
jgi:hypothetical protein